VRARPRAKREPRSVDEHRRACDSGREGVAPTAGRKHTDMRQVAHCGSFGDVCGVLRHLGGWTESGRHRKDLLTEVLASGKEGRNLAWSYYSAHILPDERHRTRREFEVASGQDRSRPCR
jgi:hypothetical protein